MPAQGKEQGKVGQARAEQGQGQGRSSQDRASWSQGRARRKQYRKSVPVDVGKGGCHKAQVEPGEGPYQGSRYSI